MMKLDLWLAASGALVAVLCSVAPATARAACPQLGEVHEIDRDSVIAISDLTELAIDDCSDAAPPATVVSAKVQLENSSDGVQTVQCTLASTKSRDVARVVLQPQFLATLNLQIANTSGGSGTSPNQATLVCRVLTSAPANTLTAGETKITTKAVKAVAIVQAK